MIRDAWTGEGRESHWWKLALILAIVITATVEEKSEVDISVGKAYIQEGSPVNITCSPCPDALLTRVTRTTEDSHLTFLINSFPDGNTSIAKCFYQIDRANESDSGVYSCLDFGTNNICANVTIEVCARHLPMPRSLPPQPAPHTMTNSSEAGESALSPPNSEAGEWKQYVIALVSSMVFLWLVAGIVYCLRWLATRTVPREMNYHEQAKYQIKRRDGRNNRGRRRGDACGSCAGNRTESSRSERSERVERTESIDSIMTSTTISMDATTKDKTQDDNGNNTDILKALTDMNHKIDDIIDSMKTNLTSDTNNNTDGECNSNAPQAKTTFSLADETDGKCLRDAETDGNEQAYKQCVILRKHFSRSALKGGRRGNGNPHSRHGSNRYGSVFIEDAQNDINMATYASAKERSRACSSQENGPTPAQNFSSNACTQGAAAPVSGSATPPVAEDRTSIQRRRPFVRIRKPSPDLLLPVPAHLRPSLERQHSRKWVPNMYQSRPKHWENRGGPTTGGTNAIGKGGGGGCGGGGESLRVNLPPVSAVRKPRFSDKVPPSAKPPYKKARNNYSVGPNCDSGSIKYKKAPVPKPRSSLQRNKPFGDHNKFHPLLHLDNDNLSSSNCCQDTDCLINNNRSSTLPLIPRDENGEGGSGHSKKSRSLPFKFVEHIRAEHQKASSTARLAQFFDGTFDIGAVGAEGGDGKGAAQKRRGGGEEGRGEGDGRSQGNPSGYPEHSVNGHEYSSTKSVKETLADIDKKIDIILAATATKKGKKKKKLDRNEAAV